MIRSLRGRKGNTDAKKEDHADIPATRNVYIEYLPVGRGGAQNK